MSAETERRLHASGLALEPLRRARTDLSLTRDEVDGLVALGEAATHDRLAVFGGKRMDP